MNHRLTCPCGKTFESDSGDTLLGLVEAHLSEAHRVGAMEVAAELARQGFTHVLAGSGEGSAASLEISIRAGGDS